jgi:hypothetical protein
MERTHELLQLLLHKLSLVEYITNITTSFTWIIILFDAAY